MSVSQPLPANPSYYTFIQQNLKSFFTTRILVLFFTTILLFFFVNDLQSLTIKTMEYPITSHTKQHINHFFYEAESQLLFISKTLARIVDKQYKHLKENNQMFYPKWSELTVVQKMVYEDKYGTTGQYTCMIGNCSSVRFYIENLWSKKAYYGAIQTIYLSYFDPVQNSTCTFYTPSDSNNLTSQQITTLLSDMPDEHTMEKINSSLFMKLKSSFNTNFDQSYEVSIAIELKKTEIKEILKSDIELNAFYEYEVDDSYHWMNFESKSSLPIFSYKSGETLTHISYQDETSNKTLISFCFKIPQIKIFKNFFKIFLLLPCLVLFILLFKQRTIYIEALKTFFKNTHRLISLYEYNIGQIFTGQSPKASVILNSTTTTEFYQQLSQIPSLDYEPIKHSSKQKIPPKQFLFVQTLKSIVQKYKNYAKGVFIEKNREIVNNKFFIHSSVNEISESESAKIKEALAKAKQLGFTKRFFKFAYLAILLNPKDFDLMASQDFSPLPDQYLKLMRQINRTVSGTDVRKAFKLSINILKQTQQQLQMRIQINLLQKYLQILKDLDIHSQYAKQLQLEKDLLNINEYIQNIKHVLNKHNKNIRTLGK